MTTPYDAHIQAAFDHHYDSLCGMKDPAHPMHGLYLAARPVWAAVDSRRRFLDGLRVTTREETLKRQIQDHVLRSAMFYAEAENDTSAMDAIERASAGAMRVEREAFDLAAERGPLFLRALEDYMDGDEPCDELDTEYLQRFAENAAR